MKRKSLLSLMLLCFAFFGVARAEVVEIGNPESTTTQYTVPVNMYYNYSLTQQIYTACEIGTAGTINSIAFYYTNASSFTMEGVQVYMMLTDKSVFDNNTDMVALNNATLVWEGTFAAEEDGWVTLELATPFELDGTNNLLVCCYDPTSGYPGSAYKFRTTATDTKMCLAYYSDSYTPSLEDVSTFSGSKGLYQYRNNIQLDITPDSSVTLCCPPTTLTVPANELTAHQARLMWEGDAAEYIVGYKKATDEEWTEFGVNGSQTLLQNLEQNTTYNVSVKTFCGEDSYSNPITANFTTLIACPNPTALTCTAVTATTAELSWTENGTATEWELQYSTDATFDSYTSVSANNTPFVELTDLVSETVYYARVMANCGTEGVSSFSNVVSFEPSAKMLIGSGTATNSYLPTYYYYKHSLTQQIYTVNELGEAGLIESIDFYCTQNATKSRTFNIYMVSTEKSSFENNADWIAVTAADLVYSGTVDTLFQGWNTFELDNIFFYDGTSNVAILVDADATEYQSGPAFRAFAATAQAIRVYNDNIDYDPINAASYTGTIESSKNQIRILKSELSDCMKPMGLTSTEIGPDFAILSWTEVGASTEWNVEVTGGFTTTWTANEIPFTVPGLQPETEYTVRVSPACDGTLWSDPLTFTTALSCPAPNDLNAIPLKESATLSWAGYSDSYIVEVGHEGDTIVTLNVDFSDGIPSDWTNNSDYPWAVEGGYIQSGNAGQASSTSAISVTTTYSSRGVIEFDAQCMGEGTSTAWDKCIFSIDGTAMFTKGANGDQWDHYIYEVAAGQHTFAWTYTKDSSVNPTGDYFAIDNVKMREISFVWDEPVAADTAGYNYTGLTPNTEYGFRVKGVCGDAESEWSSIANFTTLEDEPMVILDGGYWNNEATWDDGEIPVGTDVIVNGEVIVPAGYTAIANEITIVEGGSITIEEGGELVHSNEVPVTMSLSVNGWGGAKDDNPDNDGYMLLALPLYTNTNYTLPVEGTGFNTGSYDLYEFVQTYQDAEWRNFKNNEFTSFKLGDGYLYANEAGVNPTLTGNAVPTTNRSASLVYSTVKFGGWNLLGNPYTCKAYVDMPYYVLNEAGDEVFATTQTGAIEVFQGFFVKATASGQSCNFSITAPGKAESSLHINVNQGRGTIDNAIISFGEGRNLSKFQLNPNHTKIYMPLDGEDYAVLHTGNMGEMPVNFKAESNGTYTLSFNTEEVSFAYLHLIDNMNGNDVDLLANPSYSFEASTTDYASRFKLVFATGNADDSFAFYSNGSFIINNEGNAMLQVVDVTGRIIKSETINGSANINVNAAPGVYMLRLINGNNVKVQKVVVK